MKRLPSISLLLVLISACTGIQGERPSPTIEPYETTIPSPYPVKPVTFTTTDGINLAGTLFGEGDTAVVLAHRGTYGANQITWYPFARLLAEHGYAALAFDFRGVGQSEGQLLFGNLAMDVLAAVQFLKDQGYEQIACIGAGMGGMACIRVAQDHAFVGLVILASTMTAGSGSDILRLTNNNLEGLTSPKLFITVAGDLPAVSNDTRRMYELSPEPKDFLLLPGTRHGTDLFNTDTGEELSSAMFGFLEGISNLASDALPALQPITIENADELQLLRTMNIPDYTRGQISQCNPAFSSDSRLLVGACGNNQIPVWDVQSGSLIQKLYDMPTQIATCTFSPDGRQIACGGFDKVITLWDTTTGESISSFESHTAPIWDIAFDPTGESLVTCSLGLLSGGSERGDIRLWNMLNKQPLWVHSGTRDYLSLSFHPSGEAIAYGSIGGSVGILDAESGELLFELTDSSRNIGGLSYSPSGFWLAVGSDDNRVYLWDASEFGLAAQLKAHAGYVNGVAFNPDETLLISGSHDKSIGVWDLRNQELITLLIGHEHEVLRVNFSPDGTLIASISWDGTVRLWGVPQ